MTNCLPGGEVESSGFIHSVKKLMKPTHREVRNRDRVLLQGELQESRQTLSLPEVAAVIRAVLQPEEVDALRTLLAESRYDTR